jgi:tight adherence protein B
VAGDPGLLLAFAAGGSLGGALLLFISEVRGVALAPTNAPPGWRAALSRHQGSVSAARLLLAAVAVVSTLITTRWPVAAAAAGSLVLAWSYLFGGPGEERQAIARVEGLVTWTESLRDTVAANISLEQAVPASAARAPVLLRPALLRLAGQTRAQIPLDAALLELAEELDDPSADLVIAALVLNVRRRGDRLPDVLAGLVVTARSELDLRRRISSGRAGLRRGIQIIIGATITVAAYLTVFADAFLAPYSTLPGQVALALVVVLFAVGLGWLRRLAAEPSTVTLLARPGRPVESDERRIVATVTDLTLAPPRSHASRERARTRRGKQDLGKPNQMRGQS